MPEDAVAVRPDAMICTGRSDYPNQVNNVLCFPYIFRGALDVGASTINEAMKQAAVNAIAGLAREAPSDVVARAYGGETRLFGKDSLIPAPFDPRLILRVAPAVAKAAIESGVATRPIADLEAYAESSAALRLPFGLRHAADFCCGAQSSQARHLCRWRGRAGAAGRRSGGRGGDCQAHPHRPACGHRNAPQALWPFGQAGQGFRHRQSGGRSALSRLRGELCRDRRPARHHARCGAVAGSHLDHGHCGDRHAARRGRCDDLRARRPLPRQAPPYPRYHRAGTGRARIRRP